MSETLQPVKSAARVLQILECFDAEQQPLSVAQLADHHGWPHSSTSVLMRSLVSLGYLQFDRGSRAYFPTMRVALLGDWLQAASLSAPALSTLLQRLNDETGESIILATQIGLHAQYLRVLQGKHTIRMYVQNGTTRPLLTSGIGRALISHLSEVDIAALVRKHNLSTDSSQHVVVAELLTQLQNEKRLGYSISLNKFSPHSGVISCSLPFDGTQRPLAVGIAGLSQRLVSEEENYVEALKRIIRASTGV